MEERRRSKRLDLEVTLELERLSQDKITTLKYVHVEVQDLSAVGIGFRSEQELELDSIYDARLQIWTKEVIDAVIKVVRRTEKNGMYEYGAKFVGLNDKDALKIQIYQMFDEAKNKQ